MYLAENKVRQAARSSVRHLILLSLGLLLTSCADSLSPTVPSTVVSGASSVPQTTRRQPAWLDCSFNPRDYAPLGPRPVPERPNKRLKLTARVDYGMNLSSARRSLSAIR